MTVSLSAQDAARLRDLLSILVSPLEYEDTAGWAGAALRSLARLFHGNSGTLILPGDSAAQIHTHGMDQESYARFQSYHVGDGTSGLEFGEEKLSRAMHAVRHAALQIFSSEDVVQVSGIPLEAHPLYREVLEPSRIGYTLSASLRSDQGEALIGVGHERLESRRFDVRDREVMGLLVPAFHAGVQAWRQLAARQDAIGSMLDRLDDGAAVFDGRGRALHTNASCDDLERDDPEFPLVHAAMAEVARSFRGSGNGKTEHASPLIGLGPKSVRTIRDRYLLTPSLLPEGTLTREPAVVIIVRPASPRLPSEGELQGRFGLTRREAEVALLLARGLSNRQIAERLFLSPFTVRHHAQRVIEKVGVSSRKALPLHFLRRDGRG